MKTIRKICLFRDPVSADVSELLRRHKHAERSRCGQTELQPRKLAGLAHESVPTLNTGTFNLVLKWKINSIQSIHRWNEYASCNIILLFRNNSSNYILSIFIPWKNSIIFYQWLFNVVFKTQIYLSMHYSDTDPVEIHNDILIPHSFIPLISQFII